MSTKRTLTKSRSKQLFGVAGGIAHYMNVDPLFVRLAFVIGIFTPLPAITVYIIMALIMPEAPPEDVIDVTPGSNPREETVSGESGQSAKTQENGSAKRFARSTTDKWIAGVCGGIGKYFAIDPVIVRAAFLVAVFGFGTGVLVYLILALVVPPDLEPAA